METLFVECRWKGDITKQLTNIPELYDYKKIGLVTTVQHIEQMEQAKKFLEKEGFEVFIGKPKEKAIYPGQILGCDISSALDIKDKINCFLYIGSGIFHPIGIKMEINKPIIALDPISNKITKITDEQVKLYKIRKALATSNAKQAKKFGIIVSIKPGQYDISNAVKTKNKIERKGKEAHIFIFDDLVPESLINYPEIDCWINTACPRISLEDGFRFRKPILNYYELPF